jgi:hypothetical protein
MDKLNDLRLLLCYPMSFQSERGWGTADQAFRVPNTPLGQFSFVIDSQEYTVQARVPLSSEIAYNMLNC